MAHEALIKMRLEHAIGHDAFVRHVEIRLGVRMRSVDVHRIFYALRTAAVRLIVEAVHPAIGPRQLPGPVACGEHRGRRVIDDVLIRERHGFKNDGTALRVLAAGDRVRPRIPVEEIVKTSILLHDVHDVLDFAGTRLGKRLQGCRALHVRHRGLRTQRTAGEREARKQRRRLYCGSPCCTSMWFVDEILRRFFDRIFENARGVCA